MFFIFISDYEDYDVDHGYEAAEAEEEDAESVLEAGIFEADHRNAYDDALGILQRVGESNLRGKTVEVLSLYMSSSNDSELTATLYLISQVNERKLEG